MADPATPKVRDAKWARHILIHVIGLVMCLSILTFTIVLKFSQGAWLTLLVTTALIVVDLQDVENCVKLFVEFAKSIGKDESFNW